MKESDDFTTPPAQENSGSINSDTHGVHSESVSIHGADNERIVEFIKVLAQIYAEDNFRKGKD